MCSTILYSTILKFISDAQPLCLIRHFLSWVAKNKSIIISMTNPSYCHVLHHSLKYQPSTQSVCVCVHTKHVCRQGSQIRLAGYEALVRKDIWLKCCAAAMHSRISGSNAKERENREKRHRNKPTRPTVTYSQLLHCSFFVPCIVPCHLLFSVLSYSILT